MSDFADAAKDVQKLKSRLKDYAEEGLDKSMETVERNLERQLRINGSAATGTLMRSITTTAAPPEDGRSFTGRKIHGADYWRYLEFGTGIYTGRAYKAPDGRAPFPPIYEWVVAQGITPDPTGPYTTQRELAEAIAFSLARGTEQHKFVRPVWRGPFGRSLVVNSVQKSMQAAIKRTF